MKKSSKAWLISFISFALVIMLLSVPFYTAFAAQSSGTTYYVSASGSDENNGTTENTPFKTIEKVNSLSLSTGDEVCFKRGDLWRGEMIVTQEGVTYTDYGDTSLEKPTFYGSKRNYADADFWTKTEYENVWKTKAALDSDIGGIVFENGAWIGDRYVFKIADLYRDGMFVYSTDGVSNSHSADNGTVYMFCSMGNPGEVFSSIEFIEGDTLVSGCASNVSLSNLRLMYSNFGYKSDTSDIQSNINISGLDIYYIGGKYLKNNSARYGNGIQFFCQCENIVIDNCDISQCYDTGVTYQLKGAGKNMVFNNFVLKNSTISYCHWGTEFWFIKAHDNASAAFNGLKIIGNTFSNIGFGFGTTLRITSGLTDPGVPCYISGLRHGEYLNVDITIENNLFLGADKENPEKGSAAAKAYVYFMNYPKNSEKTEFFNQTLKNNTYYLAPDTAIGFLNGKFYDATVNSDSFDASVLGEGDSVGKVFRVLGDTTHRTPYNLDAKYSNYKLYKHINGQVAIKNLMYKAGDTVEFAVLPNEGYRIEGTPIAYGLDGKAIETVKNDNGLYSFIAPESNVRLYVDFCQKDTLCGKNLLTNSSFDNNSESATFPDGWRSNLYSVGTLSSQSFDGDSSLVSGKNCNSRTAAQPIDLDIGAKYRLTLFARADLLEGETAITAKAAACVIGSDLMLGGSNIFPLGETDKLTTEWKQYSFEFTATKELKALGNIAVGRAYNTINEVYIDRVSLCVVDSGIISNGSFAEPLATSVSADNFSPIEINSVSRVTNSAFDDKDGGYICRIASGTAGMSQKINIESGETYRLSFDWARNEDNGKNPSNIDVFIAYKQNGEWQKLYSKTFMSDFGYRFTRFSDFININTSHAEGKDIYIVFDMQNCGTSCNAYLDNICMVKYFPQTEAYEKTPIDESFETGFVVPEHNTYKTNSGVLWYVNNVNLDFSIKNQLAVDSSYIGENKCIYAPPYFTCLRSVAEVKEGVTYTLSWKWAASTPSNTQSTHWLTIRECLPPDGENWIGWVAPDVYYASGEAFTSSGYSFKDFSYTFTAESDATLCFSFLGYKDNQNKTSAASFFDDIKLTAVSKADTLSVKNGDFEDGNLNDWYANSRVSVTEAAKRNGEYGLNIDKYTGGVSQKVVVEKNKNYCVSFWAKADGSSRFINVSAGDRALKIELSAEYKSYAFEFSADESSDALLSFDCTDQSGTVMLDDVKISESVSRGGYDIRLDGTINMGFNVELPSGLLGDSGIYMLFGVDGTERKVLLADATLCDDGSYTFYGPVTSVQMTQKVTAQLFSGDGTALTEAVSRSVKDYTDYILANADDYAAELPLVKAMLNYGAAAQNYFGEYTESLANASLSEADKNIEYTVAENNNFEQTGEADGVSFYGYDLILNSGTTLRLYFKADGGSTVVFKDENGTVLTAEQYGDYLYVTLPDVDATRLGYKYTVTANDSLTIKASALSYANSVLKSTHYTHKNLMQALYCYSDAALAYAQSK